MHDIIDKLNNTYRQEIYNMKMRAMGEQLVGQLLVERNSFSHDIEFNWSLWKRYDFLLHDFRTVVEIMGQYYYTDSPI